MEQQTTNDKSKKRNSFFAKTNRIRLNLFSLAKNEIDEKKKSKNDCFSFNPKNFQFQDQIQNNLIKQAIDKKISLDTQKSSNVSSDIDEEENSSDLSSDEDEKADI